MIKLLTIILEYLPKVSKFITQRGSKYLPNKDKLAFSKLKTQLIEEIFSNPELVKNPKLIKEVKAALVKNNIVPSEDSARSLIRYALPDLSETARKNYDALAYQAVHAPKSQYEKMLTSERMKVMERSKQVETNLRKAKQQYEDIRAIITDHKKRGEYIDLGKAHEILTPGIKSTTKTGRIGEKFNKNAKKMVEFFGEDQEVMDLLKFIQKERDFYKSVSQPTPKSLSSKIHTSKIRKWKHMRDKFQSYFDDPLEAEHVMMRPDKYDLVDIGQTEMAVRFREPSYITTRKRNLEKNNLVKEIKRLIFDKKDDIALLKWGLDQTGRPNPNVLGQVAEKTAALEAKGQPAADLGLQIAITDKPTGKIKYFGKPYSNLVQLKKSLAVEPFKDGGFASIEEVIGYNNG